MNIESSSVFLEKKKIDFKDAFELHADKIQ